MIAYQQSVYVPENWEYIRHRLKTIDPFLCCVFKRFYLKLNVGPKSVFSTVYLVRQSVYQFYHVFNWANYGEIHVEIVVNRNRLESLHIQVTGAPTCRWRWVQKYATTEFLHIMNKNVAPKNHNKSRSVCQATIFTKY